MSSITLTRGAEVTHHEVFFERITSLFSRLFRAAPARQADTSDIWALYKLTRGVDSVPVAVERRLADAAAR
jgi:hypothetical protein